jgi:drug/metabolite transporter (DMT)-like permease
MIQRIQSIFLLLAGIAFFSLFGLPFATSTVAIPHIFDDKMYDIMDSPLLLILTILGGAISLVAIFLYNNRTVQVKLSNIVIVLSILLIVLAVLLVFNEGTTDKGADTITESAGIGMPFLSLIFSVLASKFIRKDDNTVKSMDRLR